MSKRVRPEEKPSSTRKKKRPGRCSDELELIKLILDENTPLRDRVLRLLERTLNIDADSAKNKAS